MVLYIIFIGILFEICLGDSIICNQKEKHEHETELIIWSE